MAFRGRSIENDTEGISIMIIEHEPTLQDMLRKFYERATAHKFEGKDYNASFIEFASGYCGAAETIGFDVSRHIKYVQDGRWRKK